MVYLVATLATMCLLNLALSLAIVRRLRELNLPATPRLLPVGATVGEYAATAVDGRTVTSSTDAQHMLVGFFSPDCGACEAQVPRFLAMVGHWDHQLAVVVGASDAAGQDVVERLAAAVLTVREDADGELVRAFQAAVFPAFYVVDRDRVVRAADTDLLAITAATPSR